MVSCFAEKFIWHVYWDRIYERKVQGHGLEKGMDYEHRFSSYNFKSMSELFSTES